MKRGIARNPRNTDPDTVQLTISDARLAKVCQVLRHFLPEAEHERCWRRYRKILEQHQLFDGSPFKKVIKFVSLVAREHGLEKHKERKLRKALFAITVGTKDRTPSTAGKTVEIRADQINAAHFIVPGMQQPEKATVVVSSPRALWLVTKRGMTVGAPVTILLKNPATNDRQSSLLFRGNVKKISDLDLGSRHKYLISLRDTELKTATR